MIEHKKGSLAVVVYRREPYGVGRHGAYPIIFFSDILHLILLDRANEAHREPDAAVVVARGIQIARIEGHDRGAAQRESAMAVGVKKRADEHQEVLSVTRRLLTFQNLSFCHNNFFSFFRRSSRAAFHTARPGYLLHHNILKW